MVIDRRRHWRTLELAHFLDKTLINDITFPYYRDNDKDLFVWAAHALSKPFHVLKSRVDFMFSFINDTEEACCIGISQYDPDEHNQVFFAHRTLGKISARWPGKRMSSFMKVDKIHSSSAAGGEPPFIKDPFGACPRHRKFPVGLMVHDASDASVFKDAPAQLALIEAAVERLRAQLITDDGSLIHDWFLIYATHMNNSSPSPYRFSGDAMS